VTSHQRKVRAAWLACGLEWGSTLFRVTQRVGWEAAALLIIAEEYQLGTTIAGFAVVIGLVGYAFAQPLVGYASARLPTLFLLQIIQLVELVGLLGMLLRFGPPTMFWCIVFIVSSALFYGGNMTLAVVFTGLRANLCLGWHPILNLETTQLILYSMNPIALFVGPVLSRWLLQWCLHQLVFVAASIGLIVPQFIMSEIGFRVLRQDIQGNV